MSQNSNILWINLNIATLLSQIKYKQESDLKKNVNPNFYMFLCVYIMTK